MAYQGNGVLSSPDNVASGEGGREIDKASG